MLLASMDIVLTFPVSVLVLITGHIGNELIVWPGWDLLHNNWDPIQLPASHWLANFWQNFTIRWNEYINPLFAIVFFVIFGMTEEARNMYRSAFFAVLAHVFGYKRRPAVGEREKSAIAFESFQVNPVRSE